MAQPAPYAGTAEDCSGFLLQCFLYFEMQPQRFSSDHAKIAYIISLLSGRALQWARTLWEANAPVTQLLDALPTHFKEVFGQTIIALSVHDQLNHLRQGCSSVAYYSLRFRTLPAASG